MRGEADEQVMRIAASVVARYCDGKNEPLLRVTCVGLDDDPAASGTVETAPAGEAELGITRI